MKFKKGDEVIIVGNSHNAPNCFTNSPGIIASTRVLSKSQPNIIRVTPYSDTDELTWWYNKSDLILVKDLTDLERVIWDLK